MGRAFPHHGFHGKNNGSAFIWDDGFSSWFIAVGNIIIHHFFFCFFFGFGFCIGEFYLSLKERTPLQMYEELQVLSPLVATREFCILRYCRQVEQGSWAIVNVSYDFAQFVSQCPSRRLPSGCLIQDMPNGYCKVSFSTAPL